MSPPTWQQMPRFAGTSRMFTWLLMLTVKFEFSVNRDRRLTPVQVAQSVAVPVAGASPAGVFSGGA